MNKFFNYIAAAAVLVGAASCTSYEIDMPENPEAPTVGREVSTNTIYQANPRFFGQTDGIKGLTAQLPRIASMDVDILWVMPVYETGELNAFGSPYCVRNFEAVNPRLGTMADLKALVDDAHSRGMKVIFDWIANHTAWDCAWITEHPDWYVHDANGDIEPANGWTDVAQLDFSNPEMCEAMKSAMAFWVKQLGIDGYRCDYANGVPHAFWKDVISSLRADRPDLIWLAETSKYDFYEDGFDMIYDWNSSTAIAAAFTGGKPADMISEAASALDKVPDGKSILRYVFNHDTAAENNVATQFGSREALPAAYVCASMLNGTPMIYSSMDATGLSGKLSFFDYRMLDFSADLSAEYGKINEAFRASGEVRRGEMGDYSNKSVLCFTRSIPGKTLLVAVNTTNETQTVRVPIQLSGSSMTSLLDGSSVTLSYELTLEPYAYTILQN